MQQQPGQIQYVMINNQMVPVQVMNQGQLQINPAYNPALQGQQQQPTSGIYQQPTQRMHQQPAQGIPNGIPQGNEQNIYVAQNSTHILSAPAQAPGIMAPASPMEQYSHKVLCYTVTYLFFFVGCIGVQYGLYGSLTAARLWISSYVFLIVTLIIFFVVKRFEQSFWKWILLVQAFFLILSFILEIAAFAMAVSHPVLFNYQENIPSQYAYYNNRILFTEASLTSGSASTYGFSTVCQNYYDEYSYSDYESYFGYICDPILGYTPRSGSYDYSKCSYLYQYFTYSVYSKYYSKYCSSYIDGGSGSDSGSDSGSGSGSGSGSSTNLFMCSSSYNPFTDYCYPLQYAMMAYAVINFIVYLMLFKGLSTRIYQFYKSLNENIQIQPQQVPQYIQPMN